MRKLGIAFLWLALGLASWDAAWTRLLQPRQDTLVTQQSNGTDSAGVSAQDDGTGIPTH